MNCNRNEICFLHYCTSKDFLSIKCVQPVLNERCLCDCYTFRPNSHNIFAHNIEIKRYFDKTIILRHIYLKAKVSMNYLDLWFVKSLPWLFNRNLLTEIKISFYRNIAILCAKMSRVNKALGQIHTQYFCTQYCNKKIKRRFHPIFFWTIMLSLKIF
jgi:hypothetical protein